MWFRYLALGTPYQLAFDCVSSDRRWVVMLHSVAAVHSPAEALAASKSATIASEMFFTIPPCQKQCEDPLEPVKPELLHRSVESTTLTSLSSMAALGQASRH